jgi:hypothetical protein
LRGLNLILRKARFATIRGRVIVPAGANPEVGLLVASDSGTSSSSGNTSDKDGKFELFGVAPGQVYVIGGYTLEGRRHRTFLPLQVGDTDINGVELRPLPPMEVTGRVRIEGETNVKLSEVQISLQAPGRNSSTDTKENGAITFSQVEPFIYRIVPSRFAELVAEVGFLGNCRCH